MENKFVLPSEKEMEVVRRRMGTSKADIEQTVSIIRTWLNTQPHLPNVMADDRIERIYISCKCRIEKVKKAIDAYYTAKNKFPELMLKRDTISKEFLEAINYVSLFISHHLIDDCHRIACICDFNPDHTKLDLMSTIKAVLMGIEFFSSFDYFSGYIFLINLKDLSAGHIAKIGVREVRAAEFILRRAYSKRIIAVHFINAPKIIDMLLSIITPVIPEKLRKRIFTHLPGSQDVFRHFPKDCLPNEIGGTGGDARSGMDSVLEQMAALREWYLEEDKYIADESKRPQDKSYDYDLFGVDGSFKKLQID